MKRYDEMVREAESAKDTDAELEGLTPVQARVSPEPGIVFSVRMSGEDFKVIQDAARARELKVGPFIRLAALAAASEALDLEKGKREELVDIVRGRSRRLLEEVQNLREVVERL